MENPLITTSQSVNFPINMEMTSRSIFYATYPYYLRPFATNWLKIWLQWFDGRVDGVHDEAGGMISTRLASTLCQKVSGQIFGGGLLFSKKNNIKKNEETDEQKKAEEQAIKFISGDYNDEIALDENVAQAILLAVAGGTSFVVENMDVDKHLWLSTYRMDEGYFNIDYKGEVCEAKLINSKYIDVIGKEKNHYILIEHRHKGNEKEKVEYNKAFADKIKRAEMPFYEVDAFYTTYEIYSTTAIINNDPLSAQLGRPMGWEEINDRVRRQIKEQFADIKLNIPIKLPFNKIGIVPFKYTKGVDNLPNLPYGQSMIQNIISYLYLYDYMHGALNTDLYLGRGRVLAKKSIQNPDNKNKAANWNKGLDSFLFTTYEGQITDEQKPVPVQFDLRSNDWEQIKNNLLESIAMTIGISPSTIAGWIADGSNRTAREISSEESSTALLVESKRKLLTKPINQLIDDILLCNGYEQCVEVKFSKSGETNTTLLLENTTNAYNSGLKSLYMAVKSINPDMSEDEVNAEIERIKADAKDKQALQPMDIFNDNIGAFDEQEKNSEGEANGVELADNSDRRMPNGLEANDQEVTA